MMSMAQTTLRGSWGSWARRYWAPWAVVRTPGVRSLMALYQDFASYKIKTLPPWIGAAEAAQRVRLQSAASGSAALTETDDGQAQLPDLSDGGVLGADELIALLQVALEMGRTPMPRHQIWRSPFAGLRETSIPVLAQAILAVYGHDDENDGDENTQPPPPGADGDGDGDGDSGAPPQGAGLAPTASGLAPLPSGAVAGPVVKTKDLRLGSMGERRGAGGFVGRLAELRRGSDALAQGGRALFGGGGGGDNEHHGAPGAHGGGVGNQMRAMMREQRRLEDQIVQANRSTQTLGDTINRQLAAQKRVMVDHNRQVAELAGVLKSLADAAGITGAAAAPGAVPGSGALGSRATLGGSSSLSVAGGTSLPQAKTGGWKRSTFGTRHLTSATAAEAAAASAVPEDPSAPTAAGAASGGSVGAPPPAGGPRLLPVPGAGGEAEIAGLRQRLDEQQKLLEAMMELLKKQN
ncbi:hypothetical protein MNEG_11575 [Monoraphidium neglectum]|uniref:Uncharacterized protein n=1 Tax=Monoraphidium neglectum TaxID=145388 RepID=A0A0D2J9F8_9CHLO|nr:hypothetical protein MNEG_11575 [Monoraphidium neglectum]KIY96387.1 hypothetical protein MNEG_11575 [Monoraphidium neglectum]|eukprot:XP_013895407.1 hypothetical protein MNEG_11575 [Monoraphidium neglectum]